MGPRFKTRQSSSRSFVQELSGLEYLGIIWRAYKLPGPRLGEVGRARYSEGYQVPGYFGSGERKH